MGGGVPADAAVAAAPVDPGEADVIEMDEIYAYVQKNGSAR
jgi:hypothetical protein